VRETTKQSVIRYKRGGQGRQGERFREIAAVINAPVTLQRRQNLYYPEPDAVSSTAYKTPSTAIGIEQDSASEAGATKNAHKDTHNLVT
jgi:hypothetical protein